jgi:hypothetical protein
MEGAHLTSFPIRYLTCVGGAIDTSSRGDAAQCVTPQHFLTSCRSAGW